jgi:hypothetical protein
VYSVIQGNRRLLDGGADVNLKDSRTLLCALQNGYGHAAALLEAKGAKKLASEQLSQVLIIVRKASYYPNRKEAIEMLLDRGASVNAAGPKPSWTA